jgi:hypothetical protein
MEKTDLLATFEAATDQVDLLKRIEHATRQISGTIHWTKIAKRVC